MMTFSVKIRKDGIIVVVDPEILDVSTAEKLGDAMERYAAMQRKARKNVLILVDARPLKHDDTQTRKYMVDRTTKMDFDRLAIFGTSSLQAQAANLMILATHLIRNKSESLLDKVKLFSDQEAAETWLKG
jgi:hypothetical protein